MGNQINITLVKAGDVIQGDGSWHIDQVARENYKLLTIRQNLKDITDPDLYVPMNDGRGSTYHPSVWVADYNGPAASEHSGLVMEGGKVLLVSEIVAKEGIDVKGKNFLVTGVEKPEKYGDFVVTARELDSNYEIDKNGLTVTFNQRAEFSGHNQLGQVKVIGQRKPTFGPFEPK